MQPEINISNVPQQIWPSESHASCPAGQQNWAKGTPDMAGSTKILVPDVQVDFKGQLGEKFVNDGTMDADRKPCLNWLRRSEAHVWYGLLLQSNFDAWLRYRNDGTCSKKHLQLNAGGMCSRWRVMTTNSAPCSIQSVDAKLISAQHTGKEMIPSSTRISVLHLEGHRPTTECGFEELKDGDDTIFANAQTPIRLQAYMRTRSMAKISRSI